ncbi:hypothetical protein [Blastochloris viridis]|uniref:Uncharacterized protein n=1 Tax=Blastochloris viridis TaxID=1079 RepID=A0A0S4PXY9_BLAVI|nr:hypothetical protein [Blastochloris viridis]CUU41156.1 hypothetical protein BVIRIDIS_01440 [Blastochloris viridis]
MILASVVLGAVALLLVPSRAFHRQPADPVPAAGVRGLPPLFAGALETLRPDTFRLPPTSESAIELARAAAGPQMVRPELTSTPTTVRAVAAPVAVARLDGEGADITGSLPPDAVALPSRQLDLPPIGVTDSAPVAEMETADLITRGAPGDPGTFPPMLVVERLFFTVDPAALPQSPLDYVTAGTELMPPRASRKGTRG